MQNKLSGNEPEYNPSKWNRLSKEYKFDKSDMKADEKRNLRKVMAIIQDIHNCYAYSSNYISKKNIETCSRLLDISSKNSNNNSNNNNNNNNLNNTDQIRKELQQYQSSKLNKYNRNMKEAIKNLSGKVERKELKPSKICKGMKPQPGYPSYLFLKNLSKNSQDLLEEYDLTQKELDNLLKFYKPIKKTNKKSIYKCKRLMGRTLGNTPGSYNIDKESKCKKGTSKSALVISPKTPIYHYYRQNKDGTWSHKDGSFPATNLDSENNVIGNVEAAKKNYTPDKRYKNNILDYTDFCGYYCVPRKNPNKVLKPDINSVRKGFLYSKNLSGGSKKTKK